MDFSVDFCFVFTHAQSDLKERTDKSRISSKITLCEFADKICSQIEKRMKRRPLLLLSQ